MTLLQAWQSCSQVLGVVTTWKNTSKTFRTVLWSGLMLGDLGRHGKGPAYNHFSKILMRCSQSGTQAPVKGRKPGLERPQTVTDTSSTGPKSDKEPLRSTDIPKKPGSTTTSVNKNYGPCWQGADPSEKKSAARLQRPPQVPKHSKMTAVLHPYHWLSCDEIDFASYLLASEYPHIHGFHSSVLFSVLHKGGILGIPSSPFVQILHTGDNHWVTASNMFCWNNQVCIYDSLSTVLYNKDKQVLSWLIRPKEDKFTVIYPAVQHQSNLSGPLLPELSPLPVCVSPLPLPLFVSVLFVSVRLFLFLSFLSSHYH
ncbi:uncharacterized protein LOC114548183 [Perca flavescens]|uniref:uncharacterized protein LOC114548183 n=1 Tax=Perca flavescens TaxID=8167 RepID=UPI00106ECF7D|nr:uncharacterized protein LOC114548183 [Perca flavescens]XP_028423774.1 uncharacterized protein LOC114548183 [Perca flavescens]XP_028423775.1 uncharacterized protein LOC114548183 [Perca flavescens]XP_028423776.1 uncharacterized protein LOC114548183 [Perca flavescens]